MGRSKSSLRGTGTDPYIASLLGPLEVRYPGVVAEYTSSLNELMGWERRVDRVDGLFVRDSAISIQLRRSEQKPRLFDFQNDLISQAIDVCKAPHPRNIALLALPTGGGKTRTAICAALEMIKSAMVRRVLWLAPTRELLEQAFLTAERLWREYGLAPDMELLRCDLSGSFDVGMDSAILFATPQMVSVRMRAKRDLPPADLIVFDEAHHVSAPTFEAALSFIAASQGGAAIIGLSATPGRRLDEETEELSSYFQNRLLTSDRLRPNAVQVLQRRGVLARLRFREVPRSVDWGYSRATAKTRNLILDSARCEAAVWLLKKIAEKEQALVFTGTVKHAHALAAIMRLAGVRARAVSGYTDIAERRRVLKAFETGGLSVLLNKNLLATGYDCPAVNHVLLTVPIRSALLFEQIVGRASRGPEVGGNARATVWQYEDHLALHGYPASYYRFEDYDWSF